MPCVPASKTLCLHVENLTDEYENYVANLNVEVPGEIVSIVHFL
jgi:hypothetical protein